MKEDNILQKIIESCEEFEKKPVTGNYKWNVGRCTDYSTRTNIGLVKFWLLDSGYFYFRISDANNVKLTATTAREAAHEALQLVKTEAEKLVEALSEPKEPFWIPIDIDNLPQGEALVKDSFGAIYEGKIKNDSDIGLCYVLCSEDLTRLYTSITHYHLKV